MMIALEGFVYRWTNQVNGRWYIGSHVGTPDDGYTGSGKAFRLAIRKYGIGNFEREILYFGPDYRNKEETLLLEKDVANDPVSYNIKNQALGGNGPLSLKTKLKMSLVHKAIGSKPPIGGHTGYTHSERTKSKIREVLKAKGIKPPVLIGGTKGFAGHQHSEGTKKQIAAAFIKVAPEGQSWCGAHQQFLPIAEFHRLQIRWNGLQPVCKSCRKKYRRKT